MIEPFPRTLLFAPAHRERLVDSAFRSDADAVVLDLEDSVPAAEKDAARQAAAATIERYRGGVPIVVRVNALGSAVFERDLRAMADARPSAVMLPKVDTPEPIERALSLPSDVALILLLESPAGILRALDLAHAAGPRLCALAFGAEDFRASMDVPLADAGALLDIARAMLSMAAAAARVPAIDAPRLALDDPDGLAADSRRARALGFRARLAIHPAQLAPIARAMAPDPADHAWATDVIRAAAESGGDAVSAGGRMIDAATVRRARRILEGR